MPLLMMQSLYKHTHIVYAHTFIACFHLKNPHNFIVFSQFLFFNLLNFILFNCCTLYIFHFSRRHIFTYNFVCCCSRVGGKANKMNERKGVRAAKQTAANTFISIHFILISIFSCFSFVFPLALVPNFTYIGRCLYQSVHYIWNIFIFSYPKQQNYSVRKHFHMRLFCI